MQVKPDYVSAPYCRAIVIDLATTGHLWLNVKYW